MANPPHSTSQEPVVSEKEWNDGFSFLQNEVHAIYTNVTTVSLDLNSHKSFHAALIDPAYGKPRTITSNADPTGRWKFDVRQNETSPDGNRYLSLFAKALGSMSSPRHATFKFELSIGEDEAAEPYMQRTSSMSIFTNVRPSFGWAMFLDMSKLRQDLLFQVEKRLSVLMEIVEFRSSRDDHTLSPPMISIQALAHNIDSCLRTVPNTRFELRDGEEDLAWSPLIAKWPHLDQLLVCEPGKCTSAKKRKITKAAKRSPSSESLSLAGTGPESLSEEAIDSDVDLEHFVHSEATWDPERRVKLSGFSLTTFRALIFYLHTGTVSFQPLKSAVGDDDIPDNILALSLDPTIRPCSPRSLYKLAEAWNLPDLMELCESRFLASISPENVLQELEHPFARKYERIAEALEDYAAEEWAEVTRLPDFDERMQTFMTDDKKRPVLLRILKKASEP